ncbi:MAG TPA: glycoside hydrolase family 1 protein [Dehalococcoidia bacterium]|nr:glycoside hydrolase family 1 protein [Dehalococcoidia bacterium]
MADDLRFPDGFYWGCSTSSHQVEGNNRKNQWWAWEREGGHIKDRTVSGPACDHYNRFEEDFALAEELGHNAHRFSIEWSRIEPQEGRWDEKEVEHYQRVVESLNRHGLTPFATLHHFTNPLWFEAEGGWLSPRAPELIARYAAHMARALGEAVPFWLTINEPQVVPAASYLTGVFPPCRRDLAQAMTAARNVLIAHGRMYEAIRAGAPHSPQIGPVLNLTYVQAASEEEGDIRAAALFDRYWNAFWLDGLRDGAVGPPVGDGEEAPGLKGAWDFIGLNYYSRNVVKAGPPPLGLEQVPPPADAETSTMGWEVYPEGFYQCIARLKAYGKPVYITENGIGTDDDEQRCRYIVRHLRETHRAIGDGVDVRSYLHWTFQDNFEWAEGFRQKFGLMAREEGTLDRVVRPSAHMFREIARANAVPAALVEKYLG